MSSLKNLEEIARALVSMSQEAHPGPWDLVVSHTQKDVCYVLDSRGNAVARSDSGVHFLFNYTVFEDAVKRANAALECAHAKHRDATDESA